MYYLRFLDLFVSRAKQDRKHNTNLKSGIAKWRRILCVTDVGFRFLKKNLKKCRLKPKQWNIYNHTKPTIGGCSRSSWISLIRCAIKGRSLFSNTLRWLSSAICSISATETSRSFLQKKKILKKNCQYTIFNYRILRAGEGSFW